MLTSTTTTAKNASLKILMLHGYTQSGTLFHSKTRALQKALIRAFPSHNVSFSFPTGPQRLIPPANPNAPSAEELPSIAPAAPAKPDDDDDGNFGWWIRPNDYSTATHYTGLETTFPFIARLMRAEGPFDGVVGFSQGAALAGLLASALETDRVFPEADMGYPSPFEEEDQQNSGRRKRWHPPLKFAVIYSGLRVMDVRCRGFYENGGIKDTRVLHVIGGVDSVLDERKSRALVDCCGEGGKEVVVHPGGHFVPSQRPWLDAVVGFVREVIEGDEIKRSIAAIREEAVEDMEVPF